MKNIIIILLVIAGIAFLAPFGGGLGYAQGGGTANVRILTDEVTASSQSGQAVAVGWSEIDTFNASNTPIPAAKTAPSRSIWDVLPMFVLIGGAGLFLAGFITHLKPDGVSDWEPDPDIKEHHSAAETKENKRRYGPKGD